MKRLLILTAVLISTSALADPANLAGTSYGFTGSATCINSQEGFNQNFTPIIPDAWLESFSVEGIRAFASGGTGTVHLGQSGDKGSGVLAHTSSSCIVDLRWKPGRTREFFPSRGL